MLARGESAGAAVVYLETPTGEERAAAAAQVNVVAEPGPKATDAGIPQPVEINEPLQGWRSRTSDSEWQVKVGHPDYRALADEPRRRLVVRIDLTIIQCWICHGTRLRSRFQKSRGDGVFTGKPGTFSKP